MNAGILQKQFSLTSWTRPLWQATRDVVLPPLCPLCRAKITQTGALCPTCWSKISFITAPRCERWGTPFEYDNGVALMSSRALSHPPAFRQARAVALYQDAARDLIHAFKYHDRLDLAPLLAGLMLRAGQDLLEPADLLIPVPLHWTRLWRRRFNQSALLASHISRKTGIPLMPEALIRSRRTPTQVGLAHNKRAQNISGVIKAHPAFVPLVKGRRILVVDDVLTSGSTANACANILIRAGAVRVDVLVFALVHHPSLAYDDFL